MTDQLLAPPQKRIWTGLSVDALQQHLVIDLSPKQQDEFERLAKTIKNAHGFRLLFARFNLAYERDTVRQALVELAKTIGIQHHIVDLGRTDSPHDFEALESQLSLLDTKNALIEFINTDDWLWRGEHEQKIDQFNLRRDALAHHFPCLHLWWLTPYSLQILALHAPDLWSWRGSVLDFCNPPAVPVHNATTEFALGYHWVSDANLRQRVKQIGTLNELLTQAVDAPTRWPLLIELAELQRSIGELEFARAALDQALPLAKTLDDLGIAQARTYGLVADILQARGELDEALRIRREEVLPVYEKLGDVRSRAMTMSKVADILQARGELDEALRIRREEELPVYEKLGDVRERAVTIGKVADILQARGELDEALRIRREEELPVYEKLGDVRSRAMTMSKVADILQARGELDEALRIRREEELPVFEKLGDVRSRAVTMGKVAYILHARGELDEALRIQREEELPVYEKLGDLHGLLVGRANLAMNLATRGQTTDKQEIEWLLTQAFSAASAMGLPEADRVADLFWQNFHRPIDLATVERGKPHLKIV